MNKTYTKELIRANLDCYNKQSKAFLPLVNEKLDLLTEPVTLRDILESGIRMEDKFWWLMGHTDISVNELQELGLKIADVAVKIYKTETGNDKLAGLLDRAKQGEDVENELKVLIKEGENPVSRSENAVKSVARAVASQFTEGHKRPLVIKASQRLVLAAYNNDIYISWVNKLLLSYGI